MKIPLLYAEVFDYNYLLAIKHEASIVGRIEVVMDRQRELGGVNVVSGTGHPREPLMPGPCLFQRRHLLTECSAHKLQT